MANRLTFGTGAALGAGLVYLFDPENGKRRRARLRDQAMSTWNQSDRLIETAQRDAEHRAQGLIAEAQAMMSSGPVPDEVLVQRVRSRLGRFASHPRALELSAENGKIHVSGPILKHEVETVLNAIQSTRGVTDVEPSLEIHETAENVPSLQGTARVQGEQPDILQENWAPATRVMGTVAGSGLILISRRMGGMLGFGSLAGGVALLLRSVTNLEIAKILGLAGEEDVVRVRKAININASPDEVFKLWANPENYPRFMEHVRDVHKTGEGRYHWVVDAPGGTTVEWDASVTHYEPGKKMGWETVPGTTVPQSGFTRLDRNEDGSTRLDVQLTYNPPGGLIGHTVASIAGQDPKTQLDDDLVRFQSLMEAGKTTAKGEEVTRDQLVAETSQSGGDQSPTHSSDGE